MRQKTGNSGRRQETALVFQKLPPLHHGTGYALKPKSACQMVGLRKPYGPSFLVQGFMDKIPPYARSPLSDVTAPAASSLHAFASCRSVPLYTKEIFSDMPFQIPAPQD